jgi:hypothetical protein
MLAGCAKRPPHEAREALASLRKIQAATEVGVNYQQYSSLLIEAQNNVNNARRVLADDTITTEITLTMDSYKDARDVWQEKITGESQLTSVTEPGKTLIPKYSLNTRHEYHYQVCDTEKALHAIWFQANRRLETLSKLIPN